MESGDGQWRRNAFTRLVNLAKRDLSPLKCITGQLLILIAQLGRGDRQTRGAIAPPSVNAHSCQTVPTHVIMPTAESPQAGGHVRRWGPPILLLGLAVAGELHLFHLSARLVAVCGLDAEHGAGAALAFFVAETPLVLLLLTLVVFAVSLIRSFIPPALPRRWLAGYGTIPGLVAAALFGVVTPFCSCSAVPLFIGLLASGVPLGTAFSFLVAAPLVNEVVLVLLAGIFGWKIALLYLASGLTIAIGAGAIIGSLRLESWVEPWVWQVAADPMLATRLDLDGRVRAGWQAARAIVGLVWPWIAGGLLAGAIIHGWMPEAALAGLFGRSDWQSVPVAVAIGVPLYANPTGIIPVMHALLAKGAALGTTIAFVMSVIGLSLPEAVMLRKVLSLRLLLLFFGIVALGILATGYLFNLAF